MNSPQQTNRWGGSENLINPAALEKIAGQAATGLLPFGEAVYRILSKTGSQLLAASESVRMVTLLSKQVSANNHPVSEMSPRLGRTPGDCRGLQGNRIVAVTQEFSRSKNRSRSPSSG